MYSKLIDDWIILFRCNVIIFLFKLYLLLYHFSFQKKNVLYKLKTKLSFSLSHLSCLYLSWKYCRHFMNLSIASITIILLNNVYFLPVNVTVDDIPVIYLHVTAHTWSSGFKMFTYRRPPRHRHLVHSKKCNVRLPYMKHTYNVR